MIPKEIVFVWQRPRLDLIEGTLSSPKCTEIFANGQGHYLHRRTSDTVDGSTTSANCTSDTSVPTR